MAFLLSAKSLERMAGLHLDLHRVVQEAIRRTSVDFCVLEGRRSLSRQKELFRIGASSTMRSRHLSGHAIDLGAWVNGAVRWDWPLYHKIAAAMLAAAHEQNVHLEWGGNWTKFPDGPHFQLSWKDYPL